MKTIIAFLSDSNFSLLPLLVWFAIAILVFLLIRSLALWYWKIDKLVENQEKQIQLLNEILLETASKSDKKNKQE